MLTEPGVANAFDALADMFLGDAPAPTARNGSVVAHSMNAGLPNGELDEHVIATPAPLAASVNPVSSHSPRAIEGVVLGHLPMMGSIWATQYVRMAAEQSSGPVCMVRLDQGMARVELFHPTGPDGVPAMALACARPCGDLDAALAKGLALATRVIVFPGGPTDELLLAASRGVSSMVILTAADDASAVGAYKAIKRLAGAGGGNGKVFRVAVMGADQARAEGLWHRLSGSAREFLDVQIEMAGSAKQIAGGVPGSMLFDGPSAMTMQAVLKTLTREAGATSLEVTSTPLPAIKEESTPVELPAIELAPEPEVEPCSMPHATNGHILTVEGPSRLATKLPESPAEEPAMPPIPAGLKALGIRCPFDSEAVLAVDGDRAPHVVVAVGIGGLAEATHRLVTVGGWMWANRELLAMIAPGMGVVVRPTLHLLTRSAPDARTLLESDIRVHLLVEPAQLLVGPLCLALN